MVKDPYNCYFFKSLGDGVIALQNATQKGASFLFGFLSSPGLPFVNLIHLLKYSLLILLWYFAIYFMSALTAWLWHIKVLKVIVDAFSKVCQKLFNIGGPIGLGAAANVFVGQVEAPLLIRPYLSRLLIRLLILLTAGMSDCWFYHGSASNNS